MIRIIAGGKKHLNWVDEACLEYEKRLKKPFDIKWEIYEEEKLEKILEKWNFSVNQLVILTDERGENIDSVKFSRLLDQNFVNSREVIIIIGGAYGVNEKVRMRADFIWSFSKLVFPHMLMRVMLVEQIYRAQEISRGSGYHHV